MRWWLVLLAVALVATPIVFTWHTELYMLLPNGTFSNGFIETEPILMYHICMYVMFAVSWVGSLMLILLEKKRGELTND